MISSWYALAAGGAGGGVAAGGDLAGGVAAGVAGLAWVTAMSSRRLVTAGGRGVSAAAGGGDLPSRRLLRGESGMLRRGGLTGSCS